MISPSNFIGRGAQPLNFQGVYYIKKNYTFNNPSEETLALVGIPLSLLHHFYDDGPNEFIAQLRARPELEFVQDVHELFWPFFDILKMFREFFELSDPTLLLLLNIEPKGTGDIKSYTLDQGLPFLEVPWKTKTMMIFLNVLKESFKKKPRSCSLALIILLLNTKNLFATVITIRKNMHMLRGRLRAYTLP